ncbi:DUF2637 domain-containing protein [Microtetraspora sp. NBRC 16547]|uniref:DUF2637 domain-containing protein n=1 Tax=Microtetraspora sp. NBRC 16547 TaxID=3030993 RepID=UPI0024A0E466|nr:DUF2637 domain-containing protein [Microtetraspora sp. NBRC 16547]GLX02649.1 hypothetical protein Misp02_67350 [Microtetraspora sp. NBRC 16547]
MTTRNLTFATTVASCAVAPLVLALAVLGGIGSFTTLRNLAEPWFGGHAWIIPIGIDVGILALLAWDLLMEFADLSWPVLRWVAWGFISATVVLNIAAASGDLTASVMHAAMPILFVTVVEGVRHLIRRWIGLTSDTRRERVPLSRWILAPASSCAMWRRMVLWDIASYPRGLQLEYAHLQAVSTLQNTYGRWLWRWKAPLSERIAIRLQLAGAAMPGAAPLPQQDADDQLIQAAQAIVGEAEQRGVRLSQMDLAAQLRAQGHRIANERLRWLTTTIGLRRDPA